ncbi:hypothetical protein AMST5_03945 [freshwater sediment metagenome]|uniref:DUF5615 domain-containing protein n=1 Tax=freshwater sediment metagenome TaxID=556182 RepID=A0AA48M4S7_9ZZZZ
MLSICEAARGVSDARVLEIALEHARILLTVDKDFGELAWNSGLPASCGVILFRLPTPAATSISATLCARIEERNDWVGHFSVVEPGRVRMRALKAVSYSAAITCGGGKTISTSVPSFFRLRIVKLA